MIRTLTGTIRTPTGEPWPDFDVQFTVKPSVTTLAASYPEETVTVTTGEDGTFAVELATGIPYQVGLASIFVARGRGTQYPPGSLFQIVVPEGEGPISLEAIRALGHPVPAPQPDIVDAVVAAVAARLIPPGGKPGDALVKASGGDYALTWGTANAHYSED